MASLSPSEGEKVSGGILRLASVLSKGRFHKALLHSVVGREQPVGSVALASPQRQISEGSARPAASSAPPSGRPVSGTRQPQTGAQASSGLTAASTVAIEGV